MINYLDKVRNLIERQKNKVFDDPYFYDVNPRDITWLTTELDEICKEYNWLPLSYIDFLNEFDGISIAFCRFYGSCKGPGIVLAEEITQHKSLLKDQFFPFGRFADGSIFIFDQQGKVYWWDKYDYDFEQAPELIADSFEEFVGECLLGKRYGEFSSTEGDSFFEFMKSQNWV